MRRLAFIAIALLLSWGVQTQTLAQEATPNREVATSPMPTLEFLGFAKGMDLASPGELTVLRIRLEPGTILPLTPDDPVGGLFIVESGALAIEVAAPLSATRAVALEEAILAFSSGGDFLPAGEGNVPGVPLTLQPGDSAYIPGNISGEIRNDGANEAVVLAFLAGPAGAISEATPAP